MAQPNMEQRTTIQPLASEFLTVAQKAAIAAFPWIGKGNKLAADGAGTEAMRHSMNGINMDARIVIGEGEMDEAPMLYIGEQLGTGAGPAVDIAVDPIEGTTLVSKGQGNSMAVIAVAEQGTLLHAPDMYMEKIAAGPKAKGAIDITLPLEENMKNVARALGKEVSELTVMVQDRPRHHLLITQVFDLGAKVRLFSDVDITGVVATAMDEMDVDLFIGTGGAPEGVIAAVALKCLGGDFQARLAPETKEEEQRCIQMGLSDPRAVLKLEDIVKTNDCFFVAAGITDGPFLKGVRQKEKGLIKTHSFIADMTHWQRIEACHKHC